MGIFDTFSDMRVFNKVEFPKFTKKYIKNESVIHELESGLVWSHISPSERVIEWFTNNNEYIFNLFKSLQDKSRKDWNIVTDDLSKLFIFYKEDKVYFTRLVSVYQYDDSIVHMIFNIESVYEKEIS